MNEPAFPQYQRVGEVVKLTDGLTKREYFAGLAMQNLQNVLLRASGKARLGDLERSLGISPEAFIARLAARQADALLAELAKK